jgi:SAM-dependent methyltransferase
LKILDAGCGDGRFLKELQKIGIKHLYGVDYSERALSFGRLLIPEANFFKADLTTKIPFEDEFFDAIFMIETLEHIIPEKINNLLINLRRVLKKDGIIVITVPSINAPLPPNSKHYQHFSIDLLRHYLEPHFKIDLFVGQDKIGFHIFKLFYRLLDNRYWEIKSLTRYYNLYIWPRFFNKCSLSYGGRRLIVRAVKI